LIEGGNVSELVSTMLKILRTISLSALLVVTANAASAPSTPGKSAARYTFSWPLDTDALMPRGGATRGAPIRLDTQPSSAWQALQASGIGGFEQDRRAILAMAGTYRSSFDFLEVLSFNSSAAAQRPYQSWGTEKVYVDADTGRSISLVHILEMRIEQSDGVISEPIVTKHWRQDWQYEPDAIVEYRGNATWQRRLLKNAERKGHWSQTVYQVDESPRYASLGVWQHAATFSSWLSNTTWRPLPRREWTVRKDYDVLIGSNRHTITANGWVQEENNLKALLGKQEQMTYLGREYGVARYQRIKDFDFNQADAYYNKTRDFWNEVRSAWRDWFKREGTVQLRGQVDQLALYEPLFAQAEQLANAEVATAVNRLEQQQRIQAALAAMRPAP
jgi:hypothetical protein